MRDWRAWVRSQLPALPLPPTREADIVDEIAQQLEQICEGARREGASEAEAEARAEAEVTDWTQLAADLGEAQHPHTARARRLAVDRVEPTVRRRALGALAIDTGRELRLAARALAAAPLFAATTIATFALGIGATAAVFSLVHGILLAPLPYPDAHRLVFAQQVVPEIAERYPILGVNPRSVVAWRASCRTSCEAIAAVEQDAATLTGRGEPEGLLGMRASAELLPLLGIVPLHGRPFTEAEQEAGRDDVVLIAYELWQRRFGADPGVVGRRILLDGASVEVVGVLPPQPRLPTFDQLWELGARGTATFVRPLVWSAEIRRSAGEYDSAVLLRVPPGVALDAATAELTALTRNEFADAPVHPHPVLQPLHARLTRDTRRPLWLLAGAVLAALLIACVNVANLLVARWTTRARELAIRTALGAGWTRLAWLVTAESLLLAASGALLGLLGAWATVRVLEAQAASAIPALAGVGLDGVTVAVTAGITILAGLACALLPAWRASRADAGDALRAGAYAVSETVRSSRTRRTLVAAEVALTTMLLVLGGVLLASFVALLRVEPGFRAASVMAADLDLPPTRYPNAVARARFFETLLSTLRETRGIEAVGLTRKLPLEGETTVDAIAPEGSTGSAEEQPVGMHVQVSAGYFDTIQLPLLRGRRLTPDDHTRPVALVSARTARAVWPGRDPIGRRFTRGNRRLAWEVVGVVADARLQGLDREPGLVVYVPFGEGTANRFSLVWRAPGDAALALDRVREAVRVLDAELPLQQVRTLQAVVDETLALRGLQLRVLVAFALAGLLLACVGIYGVVSGAVERRRGELAVRMALGASAAGVRRLVVSDGLRPVLTGLAVGLVLGVVAARASASLLFAVSPTHPGVIASVAGLIVVVALLACLGPAARAANTPLVSTLRRS